MGVILCGAGFEWLDVFTFGSYAQMEYLSIL